MTIKTEQLRHSLHELEGHLETLQKLSPEGPHLSVPDFVDLCFSTIDAVRDCIVIIFSILEEGK